MRCRIVSSAVALILLPFFAALPVPAQTVDPYATIAALETRVSELETTLAPGETPTPAPTRPPVSNDVPTVLADGLELLYYYFVDTDFGGALVLGEVRNTTNRTLDGPTLQFAYLDADGNILGTSRVSSVFNVIPAGQTMPIEGDTGSEDLPVGSWAREEIELCTWSGKETNPKYSAEGLELQDVKETEREGEKLQIEGVVRNNSTGPAENVYVRALVYSQDDKYAGVIWTNIEVAIPSNKTARFTLDEGINRFSPSNPLEVAGPNYTYELRVSRDSGVRVSMC